MKLTSVEICAGAGGQALGLHRAGFTHKVAVELDQTAAQTLRQNLGCPIRIGDVADSEVWDPSEYRGVDLLAGGVPCPPFSLAGKQLGPTDERDLFAWAVEQVAVIQPRALLLENVRGLAATRFSAYRQRIMDRLQQFGYVADWRLMQAADFGLAQLRPRFVLVAMRPADAAYFRWPEAAATPVTVGEALRDLMGARGWRHVDEWARLANDVGPTIVGGSKKHGGPDLGPTRAKAAWASLGVDGKGIADEAPDRDAPSPSEQLPRLTLEMVARLQGWRPEDKWTFTGTKTSKYRQIGNAFPPPIAEALGWSIRHALERRGTAHSVPELQSSIQDPIYQALSSTNDFVPMERLLTIDSTSNPAYLERRLAALGQDFDLEARVTPRGTAYRLGEFKGFLGQAGHRRHDAFEANRRKIS